MAKHNDVVLVGVLKSVQDLQILLRDHWYRIPADFMPKRKFGHIGFYQPTTFGKFGKRIEYYAKVTSCEKFRRLELLPQERNHLHAEDWYWKIGFDKIYRLARPIKNIIPRRVTFGFTTISRLLQSRNILELYGVAPTERIMAKALERVGIKPLVEYRVSWGKSIKIRYRLDLAIFCKNGRIAIECDNDKAHASRSQRAKDQKKDRGLKRHGWKVLRLKECDITEHLDQCVSRVRELYDSLGGPVEDPSKATGSTSML